MKNKSSNHHRGLLAGGNWIIDQVKIIDVYPRPEQLGNIRSQSQGTGGAPYNVLIDLARSGASFPLLAAGLVGKDPLGGQILADCRKNKIDASAEQDGQGADVLHRRNDGAGDGRRTFFHAAERMPCGAARI
jgi:sugar/nucleoside kinase (ribokinase family)